MRKFADAITLAGNKGLVFLACFGFCVLILLTCLGFAVLMWTFFEEAIL